MDGTLLSCMILAVTSVLLVIVASQIKDDRFKVNGKECFDTDDDNAGLQYERRCFLQYLACVLSFISGCNYGVLWGIAATIMTILIIRIILFLKKE